MTGELNSCSLQNRMATTNRLAGHLAHFKVPKFFHFTNEFPVTVTGKVRKVEMREMAKKILGL